MTLAGLALIFYLSLHIWVIHSLTYGERTFDSVMKFLSSPLFKLLEVSSYEGWITVELYTYPDRPEEAARESLDFLQNLIRT